MSLRPRARRTRLTVVSLVIACLVVITVDYEQGANGPLEGLGKVALGVISPLQEAVSKITRPVGDFFSAIGSLPSLKSENERLQQELDQARAQLATQSDATARVAELEELLGFTETIPGEEVAALVISNGVSNFEWSITVDKGSSDGVQVGDAVIASAGLVGHVTRTTGGSAEVQLITDPDSGVSVGVTDVEHSGGVLVGGGENDMKLELLPTSLPAEQLNGKSVETRPYAAGGFSNRYPPGILVGRVSRVLDSSGALSKFVAVQPTVDFSSLSEVLVVLSEAPA